LRIVQDGDVGINSKLQTPNTREAPNLKHQPAPRPGIFPPVIGIWRLIGSRNLEIEVFIISRHLFRKNLVTVHYSLSYIF
jgi:hypothetical protein